jgi:RNA polymerase sigma factor (sigma-70 family)
MGDEDSPGPPAPGSSADEDAQLLARWRAGDRDAGNRLVRKHYRNVTATFVNSVGDDDRQDLVQETFGRLTTAKDGFRGEGGVRAYILAIARNVLLDHLRRRYRGNKDFDPLTHTVEDVDGATPSQVVAEVQRTHRLLTCLRALPIDIKQMLEYYYWQGLTAEALGKLLATPKDGPDGIPPGTIRRRIHDAKVKLRACMDAGGAAPAVDGVSEAHDLDEDLRALGRLLTSGPARA